RSTLKVPVVAAICLIFDTFLSLDIRDKGYFTRPSQLPKVALKQIITFYRCCTSSLLPGN
ncbi:hypothetical protein, partial [Pseudomonas frederiksbergensis]|uniref:hypothetical protein n=1 Tax=Pseudomonas frederiksbergensis TaxID=104087 RepID=UPI001C83E478